VQFKIILLLLELEVLQELKRSHLTG